METDAMKNVEAVIKKWQDRADPTSGGNYRASIGNDAGKKAWQEKFGANLQAPQRAPSRYRPKKRKPKV